MKDIRLLVFIRQQLALYKLDTAKSDLATFDVSFSYYQFAPIRVAEDEPVSPLDAQDTFSRTLGLRDV